MLLMEIPDAMVDTQISQMANDFAQRIQSQGLTMEQYYPVHRND